MAINRTWLPSEIFPKCGNVVEWGKTSAVNSRVLHGKLMLY